ncbi:MAG: glycoside hydrolase family 20 zincin-like fold domain-containing protein [Planctomycetota bacterium]
MSGFRQRWSAWIFAVGVLVAPAARSEEVKELGVVPVPRRVEWREGNFTVDVSTPILLSADASAEERFAARDLQEALRERLGLTLGLVELPTGDGPTIEGGILLGNPRKQPPVASRMKKYQLELDEKMAEEGYVLGVGPEGVVLAAESPKGILYATMSLRHMLFSRPTGEPLPGVRVHDWPAMKLRGVHDEFSYGQVSTMQNFKDVIKFLAEHKMNTLIYYFEDTFSFKQYPTIGVGRGALTREQIDELEAYAKPYGVEIFPVFEMLGNQGALLMLDEIRPLAEFPGSHSFAINDDVYKFLENCFNELADAFDSKYFHAGLDESWDLGFGKTEARVQKEGRGPVHADHYRKLNEMIKQRGKTMMMYGDIIVARPEILDLIPKDIILMDWKYDAQEHYPSVDTLAKPGFPLLVLPGMSNWDRIFPEYSQALINIKNFTLDCYKHPNCLGSITSTWGDNGSKNLRELLYSGYAYGAEVTWSPETTEVGDFHRRFFTLWNGPGTSPYFEAIYGNLEKWPWWYPMLDYFRHPFLPRKDERPHEEKELYRVGEDARVAEELIDELAPKVTRRKGDLDYLRYCARMHQNYVRGQRLVRELQRIDPTTLSKEELAKSQATYLPEVESIRSEVEKLRDRFKDLWLRTNIPANLHYAIGEYDMMIKAWADTADRIRAGKFAFDPRPAAEWIYHPEAFREGRPVQNAYFRKTFTLDPKEIARAGIQVHGDTHVVIHVNGKQIGEQFVRRNLSCPINPRLLVVYDILPHLREGTNVIAIEAHCYGTENKDLEPGGPDRSGGFHLYGEIVDKQGKMEIILSDNSWRVSARKTDTWTSPDEDDRRWRSAQGDPKPTIWITYPDFTRGLRGFADVR